MNCQIISFINYKGGVGKTTSAVIISRLLSEKYGNVLLIDTDPNYHATGILLDSDVKVTKTFSDFLKSSNIKDCILNTTYANLDIIPGSLETASVEKKVKNKNIIKNKIKTFKKQNLSYQFIIFDTPSTAGFIIDSVITASTINLIPLQPDLSSLNGVKNIVSNIGKIAYYNKRTIHFFIFFTLLHQSISAEKNILENIKSKVSQILLDVGIYFDKSVIEANASGDDILKAYPGSEINIKYDKLLKLLFERIKLIEGTQNE